MCCSSLTFGKMRWKRMLTELKACLMHILPHRSHRSPASITKSLREELVFLQTGIKPHHQLQEFISRYLEEAKHLICDHDAVYYQMHEHSNPVVELAEEFCYDDLWSLIVAHLSTFSFEAKKDVSLIFINLLERRIGSRSVTAEYLRERPEILYALIKCYSHSDHETSLVCGQMLRECARFELLAECILNSKHFFNFFDYMQTSGFEVQTDAFNTFRTLLQSYKPMTAKFLIDHYDRFFGSFAKLVTSENYITRRLSIELLGELLLDSYNQDVTDKFIESADNLLLIIAALQDRSHIIELEAFNVFKIFVTNPHKSMQVVHQFIEHRPELIKFLECFLRENDDESFLDEKAYVIKELEGLSLDAVCVVRL